MALSFTGDNFLPAMHIFVYILHLTNWSSKKGRQNSLMRNSLIDKGLCVLDCCGLCTLCCWPLKGSWPYSVPQHCHCLWSRSQWLSWLSLLISSRSCDTDSLLPLNNDWYIKKLWISFTDVFTTCPLGVLNFFGKKISLPFSATLEFQYYQSLCPMNYGLLAGKKWLTSIIFHMSFCWCQIHSYISHSQAFRM